MMSKPQSKQSTSEPGAFCKSFACSRLYLTGWQKCVSVVCLGDLSTSNVASASESIWLTRRKTTTEIKEKKTLRCVAATQQKVLHTDSADNNKSKIWALLYLSVKGFWFLVHSTNSVAQKIVILHFLQPICTWTLNKKSCVLYSSCISRVTQRGETVWVSQK